LPVALYSAAFDARLADSGEATLNAWHDLKNTRVKIMARSVSAVLAAALVVCTYLVGDALFGSGVALLAVVGSQQVVLIET
jgi:hypothetical protein